MISRKLLSCLIWLGLASWLSLGPAGTEEKVPAFFPDIAEWSKPAKPTVYRADNLFEYINGAAESYLSYDFRKLYTQTYENRQKQNVTIDIYEHGSPRNAFGIYSQERPLNGEFLAIGSQGCRDTGMLNFIKGNYFVKLSGVGLDINEPKIFQQFATETVKRLPGVAALPQELAVFPDKGKVAHSEQYQAKNFLGHEFLHSVFLTEYNLAGKKVAVFLFAPEKVAEAETMLSDYQKFATSKGQTPKTENGLVRFIDPYYQSRGMLNLKREGNFLLGFFGDSPSDAESLLTEMVKSLGKIH
jgi:hypothetical protein